MSRLSLDTIQIATPCGVSWEAMTGDDQVRFCHDCKLRVYNISEMTRQDAQEVLERKEGRLCIRLYRRADGTLISQDCPVGVRRRFRKTVGRIAFVLVVGSWLAAALNMSGPTSRRNSILRDVEPFKTLFGWLLPPTPVFRTVAQGLYCTPGGSVSAQPAEPVPQPENPEIGKQAEDK